ncbi:MAG: tetratricopeptide repeat protein [Verrucomicrobia bacterium]|nr:tetratricopeptide repeat protein [Verrucomicrobiota bacterium]
MKSGANNSKSKRGRGAAKSPQRAETQREALREPAHPLSARRVWFFRLLLVLFPVLALGLLEIGLRLGGYGYPTGFFKEVRSEGRTFLIDNEKFSQRFFPPELARWPGSFKFDAKKPAGLRRIFIFGESAAMGDPQPAYGASRYLEVLLRERFPGEKFEVINLGITAVNSHVILPIARECAKHQGDLWIIYMGNNEMVGPFGPATVFGSSAMPLVLVKFMLAVQQTRVGQMFVSWSRHLGGKSKNTTWGGMQMFLQNQIPPADPRKETAYRNFARNLQDIVAVGLDSGARIVLNTISVNLRDCPPFASLSNQNLPAADRAQFDHLYAEGLSLEKQVSFAEATRRFEAAARIDAQFAELQFRWAASLLQLTNAVAARTHFQLACDTDALPFRADSRINELIKEVAQATAGRHLVLCDAEAALAADSPVKIAGDESFFEHVHFNFDGNYRLGLAWAEQVVGLLALPTNSAASAVWPAQARCDEDLGLTDWNREFVLQSVLRRMNSPPLSSQFNNAARLQVVQAQESVLQRRNAQPGATAQALTVLNAAIRRAPGDHFLYEGMANVLEAVGDPKNAILAYRELLKLLPHDAYASQQIGRLLGEQGQPQQGEPFLRTVTRLRPSSPDGWRELGVVLAAQEKFPDALECLRRAERLSPQDPDNVCYTGKILAKMKRRAEAIAHYRRAIQMRPDFWEAHFELASELAWENEVAESIREYLEALRINPRHAVSHVNLGVMLVRENRHAEAIQQFEQALVLDPNNAAAKDYLRQVTELRNRNK